MQKKGGPSCKRFPPRYSWSAHYKNSNYPCPVMQHQHNYWVHHVDGHVPVIVTATSHSPGLSHFFCLPACLLVHSCFNFCFVFLLQQCTKLFLQKCKNTVQPGRPDDRSSKSGKRSSSLGHVAITDMSTDACHLHVVIAFWHPRAKDTNRRLVFGNSTHHVKKLRGYQPNQCQMQ